MNSAPVDVYPLNESYTEAPLNQSIPNIALRYTAGMASVFVTINHDLWPSETGWRLQRALVEISESPFRGVDFELIFHEQSSSANASEVLTWEVQLLPGAYTLQVFDAFGDGIAGGRYQLSYQSATGPVFFYDSNLYSEGTAFTTESQLVWFIVESDKSMTTSKLRSGTGFIGQCVCV